MGRREPKIELKIARRNPRAVITFALPQRPVSDPDAGRAVERSGDVEACARGSLVVAQPPVTRIGERAVREQKLVRCEPARIVFRDAGAMAEESDLEAGDMAARIFEPAGDVPPFIAEAGVAAVVAWKLQRVPGGDFGIRLCSAGCCSEKQRRACEKGASPHRH